MEKIGRLEDDPSSLTSFNFIPEGDEEGLISKIFSKFKTAVSGPNQQITSPSSSTRTISIVLSNESGMITDQVVPEQHFVTMEKTQSNTTITSSSAITTDTITPSPSVIAAAVATGVSTATESNTSNTLPLPIHTQTSASTNNYASTTTTNTASSSALSSTPKQDKDVLMKKTTPTITNTDNSNLSSSLTTPTIIKTTPSTPAVPLPKHKHIIIDEDQNQQQQIPSSMLIPLTKTSSIDSDTQSVMTTFSVSNTNSLSRILNRLRGGESLDSNKDFWMPDEQCKECNNCNAPFNLFRRKHHCRTCGKVVILLIYLVFGY